jgi:hypothetical protein
MCGVLVAILLIAALWMAPRLFLIIWATGLLLMLFIVALAHP